MFRFAIFLFCSLSLCAAEVRVLTLREAIDLALKQNPDVVLARLDRQKADEAVRLAKDPFIPKVYAGSGLAYSSGIPMSIEGATPSIFQARAVSDIFNRPQSYRIASAKESSRGAAIDASAKQEEVAYRAASLFFDAEAAAKSAGVAHGDIQGLEDALSSVRARVSEGRELPLEAKRAELNLARARYRAEALDSSQIYAETSLAAALGLAGGDQARPAAGESRALPEVPATADAAAESALKNSKEIRSLESKLMAKGLDIRAASAQRLPTVDLVAEYALLAKFNNYSKYFLAFQRNDAQLGMSFTVPVWTGPGVKAAASQAGIEAEQLRTQMRSARGRIENDARKAYADLQQAASAQDIARLDLDVTREQVSVLLAQTQEGRAELRQLQEARAVEAEKWIAFYDASAMLEKARLNLLRQTGELIATLCP
jgi:outer membrane protein TolC